MKRAVSVLLTALTLVFVLASEKARAAILVDQTSYYANAIGVGDWSGAFTSAIAAQPGGYFLGSVENAADVAAATAILVVYRNPFSPGDSLSASALANLTAFAATGGNILLTGEIAFDPSWNNSILSFASGGTASAGANVFSGSATPVVMNALTNGVTTIALSGVGTTTGGTALFSTNFATLWAPNVLTVLDSQVFANGPGNPAFRQNVADWLGDSVVVGVPEPSTWAMIILGFAGVGAMAHRSDRKGADASTAA